MTVSVSAHPYVCAAWLRIPEQERAAIAAAVPDGMRLHISPGYRAKPGTADVGLRDAGNSAAGPVQRGFLTASLCWSALPRVVVTTDAGGNVTSIEEIAA